MLTLLIACVEIIPNNNFVPAPFKSKESGSDDGKSVSFYFLQHVRLCG